MITRSETTPECWLSHLGKANEKSIPYTPVDTKETKGARPIQAHFTVYRTL